MSQLMSHVSFIRTVPLIPKTNEGFLYNHSGDSLNSLGHRCQEVSDVLGTNLDFRKYFLVLGDNAGLHMHKPVEETWPYLLATTINYQYYNLAILDGGLEGVRYNLFNWLNMYSKPKMIFISCEWANRFIGVDYEHENTRKASELADDAGFFKGRRRLFSALLEHIDIPIYQIVGPHDVPTVLSDSIKNIAVEHSDDAKVAEIVSEGFLDAQKRVSV